jgi:hypothetical protein
MTLVASGSEIKLQGLNDTNPSTTVETQLLDTTMTTGLDALMSMIQNVETGGDGNYAATTVWQGDMYGFNSAASNFSSSYIHQRWPMNAPFAAGENRKFSSTSAYGSLGSTSYSDAGLVSRTIKILTWGLPDASPAPNTTNRVFCFALSGSSVTNSDNTFEKIKITTNGGTAVTINRTDLAYDQSEAGNSWWEWHGNSGTVYNAITSLGTPSTGTSYDVEIISGTTTTTLNTGIAEEMTGADNLNVAISDYYKNGDVIGNVTGIPEEGSPPAEIKFSDFYSKTFIPQEITHTTTILPDYWAFSAGYTNYYSSGYMDGDTNFAGIDDTIGDATFPNSGSITFGGLTRNANDIQIKSAYFSSVGSSTTSNKFNMSLEDHSADHGTSWTKTGFTAVEIYLDQSDNSGTPDLTLPIGSATLAFTDNGSYTRAFLSWSTNQSYSNYFGTNTTPSNNGTQTIAITGLS